MHFADILAVYSLAELFEHTTSVLLISSFSEFSCLTYQCDVNAHTCTLPNAPNSYTDASTVSCYSVRAIARWAHHAHGNRCLSVMDEDVVCWWISLCWTLKVDTPIRISSKNLEDENRWSWWYYNNALLAFSIHFWSRIPSFAFASTSNSRHSLWLRTFMAISFISRSGIFSNLLDIGFLKKLEARSHGS